MFAANRSLPTIVGSGLTGLFVSRALSRAAVPHVLVGGAPPRAPRLGESLNLEGTLGALEAIPELAWCFAPKREVLGFVGDHVLRCDFALGRRLAARALFRALGHAAPDVLLNVDRVELDAALHALVVDSPLCHAIDARVTGTRHDPRSDAVVTLELDDGRVLEPSYVFDATNHARLVARAAEVPVRPLGPPQRVAFAHYHPPEGAPRGARAGWEDATSIVRLDPDADGRDGLAWLIPVPGYVSVGASHDAAEGEVPGDALLDAAERAFARRGLRVREPYAERSAVVALPFRNFAHERAFGANWMLAGPTFAQIWWTSGSGVGTSFAAARVAPAILRAPRAVGRAYQAHMAQLLDLHDVFEWFARADCGAMTAADVAHHADRFVAANLQRLASGARRFGGPAASAAGAALAPFLAGPRRGRTCTVTRLGAAAAADAGAPR